MSRLAVLDDPVHVAALAHPARVRILDALRAPGSASSVARALGMSRQSVNYHVKTLLDAGLIELVEERRSGNFVEQVYRSIAGTFVVSPRLAWGDGDERDDALRRQLPLEHLVALGERVQHDAATLLDRAAFDGDEIACASIDAEIRFPDDASRAAFMDEYLALLQPLLKKHGARRGDRYRVAVAVYPNEEES